MRILIAPKAALAPTQPSVGIFWRVDGVLVIDRSTLESAEAYGECITHAAGHYERWQQWQALGAARRAAAGYPNRIASTEYDEWPRGRIVYETPSRRFVIYADRRPSAADVHRCREGDLRAERDRGQRRRPQQTEEVALVQCDAALFQELLDLGPIEPEAAAEPAGRMDDPIVGGGWSSQSLALPGLSSCWLTNQR